MNPEAVRKEIVSKVKRVVLKLGSSVVTSESGLDETAIKGIVDDVCRYKALGKE